MVHGKGVAAKLALLTRIPMFKFGIILFLLLATFSYAQEDMVTKLPKPKEKGAVSLEEAIKKRRSERNLSGKELSIGQISQLLWSCQGITDEGKLLRSAPSAGATYPLEVYFVNKEGMFYYIPQSHSIKKIQNKDLREELSAVCLGQRYVKDAPIDIIICADFKRATGRYGLRGEKYAYIEVGHAAENLNLEAVSLGLGSVCVGAFSDTQVQKLLNLPEDIVPLYIIPVGYVELSIKK